MYQGKITRITGVKVENTLSPRHLGAAENNVQLTEYLPLPKATPMIFRNERKEIT